MKMCPLTKEECYEFESKKDFEAECMCFDKDLDQCAILTVSQSLWELNCSLHEINGKTK